MIESFNCPDHASTVSADSAVKSSYAFVNFTVECSSAFCF